MPSRAGECFSDVSSKGESSNPGLSEPLFDRSEVVADVIVDFPDRIRRPGG